MKVFLALAIVTGSLNAFARKDCAELKTEIEEKLKAKGVQSFTLEIIAADQVKEQKIVGSCDGGTKKISYVRH